MAGTTALPAYDASQVGSPYQEFIKSLPFLATSFDTVYSTVASPVTDATVQQPAPAPQSGPAPGPSTTQMLMYGGIGVGALLAVVLLAKALG